ncbi:response regulator [Providencia sp. JGM181]|uniref:Two-component system response regulator BasR n=1 Tax=Providencia alcalifaciens TaxID=126385 RepID=A0A4R3NTE7_9GAMM|nr:MULTISPECIES: response regulator [Providencia]MBC5790907.1 response regulator [Providencia sp. JUb39]MBS0923959.1 response regulator [Providencia sp. JGM181]MBS0932973.1 response regulator [Providencia sp. JGM172]MBS0997166.1 response regulator [Providencia sp. JGM178]TCT36691.1 two-component system response regulator BasR [Providencia alcalifaciens]
MNILLVEDDLQLGKALCRGLELAGFNPCWVRLLSDAKQQLQARNFDVMLLDLGLPDGDGQEELISWRQSGESIPIIILTARNKMDNLVASLDSGADDFLTKPFEMPELISRVKAISRRMAGFSSEIWQLDNLQLNPLNHQVTLDGQLLLLSGKEYLLLYELIKNADNVVRKTDLEQRLFGLDDVESNSLEVHIHNLRRKIGKDRIITIRGIGYLLKKEAQSGED